MRLDGRPVARGPVLVPTIGGVLRDGADGRLDPGRGDSFVAALLLLPVAVGFVVRGVVRRGSARRSARTGRAPGRGSPPSGRGSAPPLLGPRARALRESWRHRMDAADLAVQRLLAGDVDLRRLRPATVEHVGVRARIQTRAEAVRPLLAEAADEDPAFDHDALVAAVRGLAHATRRAWTHADRRTLGGLLGDRLFDEWDRRLRALERDAVAPHSRLLEDPAVDVVGVVNRPGTAHDRVVVHLEVRDETWVRGAWGTEFPEGRAGARGLLREYWTLARRDAGWILLAVEGSHEGRHHLDAPVVATPGADPQLGDRVRTALAVADATGDAAATADLVPASLADDARATMLDLALVDDRFAPDVVAAEVRATVLAWVAAIDGPEDDLRRRASADAVGALLRPDADRGLRTVLRAPRVDEVRVEAVDPEAPVPRLEVVVRLRARWYRERRATGEVLAGSRVAVRPRDVHWTLELADRGPAVWRLVAA